VHALEEPLLLELREVAAERDGADAEVGGEVGDADEPVALEGGEDVGAPARRQRPARGAHGST
jgi:hypothetical protein